MSVSLDLTYGTVTRNPRSRGFRSRSPRRRIAAPRQRSLASRGFLFSASDIVRVPQLQTRMPSLSLYDSLYQQSAGKKPRYSKSMYCLQLCDSGDAPAHHCLQNTKIEAKDVLNSIATRDISQLEHGSPLGIPENVASNPITLVVDMAVLDGPGSCSSAAL